MNKVEHLNPQGLPRRRRYPMPALMKRALTKARLVTAYRSRPPYQRNDYIGWILQAKREHTRDKRLAQMLEELRGGRLYMNMVWKSRLPG
jgi:uncharacterized protein YdeI (YjbR/CyaY-like superfamily)